jgi:hypothetical protein
VNAVLPRWQHRSTRGFVASQRISGPTTAAFSPAVRDGSRLYVVPPRWRHRVFWGLPPESSLCAGRGYAHGPGVGEHRPRITVVPRWHHRLFWSNTESPRIRSSMQRAGLLRTAFHCAPGIEDWQSLHPRKRNLRWEPSAGPPMAASIAAPDSCARQLRLIAATGALRCGQGHTSQEAAG